MDLIDEHHYEWIEYRKAGDIAGRKGCLPIWRVFTGKWKTFSAGLMAQLLLGEDRHWRRMPWS